MRGANARRTIAGRPLPLAYCRKLSPACGATRSCIRGMADEAYPNWDLLESFGASLLHDKRFAISPWLYCDLHLLTTAHHHSLLASSPIVSFAPFVEGPVRFSLRFSLFSTATMRAPYLLAATALLGLSNAVPQNAATTSSSSAAAAASSTASSSTSSNATSTGSGATSTCTGNTADDRTVWCDYDISTDYYNDGPDTGVTREYYFVVSDVTVSPDGVSRSAMAVNGSIPGPTIVADWGDQVRVTVLNNLTTSGNGSSIHWHGIRQNYSWFPGLMYQSSQKANYDEF